MKYQTFCYIYFQYKCFMKFTKYICIEGKYNKFGVLKWIFHTVNTSFQQSQIMVSVFGEFYFSLFWDQFMHNLTEFGNVKHKDTTRTWGTIQLYEW